jgi:hypothetical protein
LARLPPVLKSFKALTLAALANVDRARSTVIQ